MNLEEFINQEIKRLREFESMWNAGHNNNPDVYPLDMYEGDWLEQYNLEHEDTRFD